MVGRRPLHQNSSRLGLRLHFELRGPPRVVALFALPEGANLTDWSLAETGKEDNETSFSTHANATRHKWHDRDCFFVTFLRGGGESQV